MVSPVDPDATAETVSLFQNMFYQAGDFTMYGHQEDQASNSTNRLGAENPSHAYGTSAVYEKVGMYPGIFGWDIGHIELKNDVADWGTAEGTGRPPAYRNGNVDAGTGGTSAKWNYTGAGIDGISVPDMAEWIREGASWDGINTISVHSLNPVTYGVYDYNLYKPGRWQDHSTGTATSMVLPGGELNARYTSWLDAYVDFNELLKDDNGDYIPIIFRPYHEHSGDWFWWGIDDMERGWAPAETSEFVDLWRYTVDYFRGEGVHNFLYAISPDRSRMGEPSYLLSDLVDNPANRELIDSYIDLRFTGENNAGVRATAHAAVRDYYAEANAAGFDESSPRWEEPIALNYQAVPLDLQPETGAVQNDVSTEFDAWLAIDEATGTSRFEDFFWDKYLEGFPGADYVDVYGLDNYWENGNGHSYNPYRGATAKLKELFVASINTVAKHAREDGRIVALTEGSFSGAELINRIRDNGSDTLGEKYPYAKYTSYAMTWWGNINDDTLTDAAQHPGFRWVSDAEVQPIDNAVPHWYTDEVGCSEPTPPPTTAPPTTTPPSTPPPSTAPPTGGASVTDLVAPYEVPGFHNINGRRWYTSCEPYSQTVRCRTDIWATQVSLVNGRFVQKTGWFFNNLTYLPFMTRAQWARNPLGHTNAWTAAYGRMWKTECDTAVTGANGCRSYIWSSFVAATRAGDSWSYAHAQGWTMNNMVKFRA